MDLLLALILGSPLGQVIDTDRDGLWDVWEINGFGPIDPTTHSVNPKRADVFILFKPRSGVKRSDLDATVRRVVKFYADLNYVNPNGSKGLNAIPIILPNLDVAHDGKDYKELYETSMPKEWRGLGH